MSHAGDGHELAGFRTLLRAIYRRRVLLLLRYPVNTLAQLAGVILFFAVVFFGGEAVARAGGAAGALGGTFDALIVGWFLWTMSLTAYIGLTMSVIEESQWGTLERLYMTPYGFGAVMAAIGSARLLESLLWGAITLAAMLAMTGRSLSLDLLTVVPISVLAIASVVGIGFVFGGLALLYKRIENVNQVMQVALIGLIAAPAAGVDLLRFLPLVQGSAMLQGAMREGIALWAFPPADLAVLAGTAVAYPLLGYAVFARCTRRARRLGLMGHY